jgi:hypothetical protein
MPSKRKLGRRKPPPFARSAKVIGTTLEISLDNGTTAVCPLDPYPGIKLAPERARRRVRVIRPGIGLRWPDLGYELGIEGLLRNCTITSRRRR